MKPVGMKIYKYDNGELLLYRIIDENFKCIRLNSNKDETKIITEEEIKNDYIMLRPDAFCNMFTTEGKYENDIINDVYIIIHKSDSMEDHKDMNMIIRQNILSRSKNTFNIMQDMNIYLGDCITSNTLPPESTMKNYMEFDDIKHTYYINLYLDDTLNDIFKCIPKEEQDIFNKSIDKVRDQYSNNKQIKGISKDIKSLFTDNMFMINYRSIFNIIQVDFTVDLGKQSYNSEGNIILNNKQLSKLEFILQKHIRVNTVLKYDKDLDIGKVVTKTHCLISDKNGIIYFISYSVISDIYDDDISKAFKF